MKKLCSLALAGILAASPIAALGEGEDIRVYLDGKKLELKDANGNVVTPIVIDGTTYLPVRAIGESLELTVSWDDLTRSVHLSSKDNEVIAATTNSFENLSQYIESPYTILGSAALLDALKTLMGSDYESLLYPLLATCYASGDDDMITLHCSDSAVIDLYKDGTVEVALRKEKDKDFDDKNIIKYYSIENPDYIESKGIIDFISQNISLGDAGYNIIDFVNGSSAPQLRAGVYEELSDKGSFTLEEISEGNFNFKGSVDKGDEGNCNTRGTVRSNHGSWLCTENGAPSILFAFSDKYMTVIGLNNVTKVLTSVYSLN